MRIRVSPKMRGVLDISSINVHNLVAGDVAYIDDAKSVDANFQAAINMGWIVIEELPAASLAGATIGDKTDSHKAEKTVCFENLRDQEMNIDITGQQVKPHQQFRLTESQAKDTYIRSAIEQGWIGIVANASHEVSEGELNASRLIKSTSSNKEEEDLETNDELSVSASSYDPDIDPRQASVVWNPNREQPIKEMKKIEADRSFSSKAKKSQEMQTVSKSEDKESNATGPESKNAVIWNPSNVKEDKLPKETSVEEVPVKRTAENSADIIETLTKPVTDIKFVDNDEIESKLRKHPKLADKADKILEQLNQDTDLID